MQGAVSAIDEELNKYFIFSNNWDKGSVVKEWEKTEVKPEFRGNWVDGDDISRDREHGKGMGSGG